MTEDTPQQNSGVDFSQYVALFAGNLEALGEFAKAVAAFGVKVRLVAIADGETPDEVEFEALDEFVPVTAFPELAHQSFRRSSSANVVVVGGAMAYEIERILRPLLEEDAAASLNPVLPLVRLEDPSLEDLVTLERWAYFLVGRALGLPPFRAREFMEECCGYQNKNQIGE